MDDRAQALAILQRARDLLAERLTERVVQAHEAILADALGMTYGSEIDAIYEQLGARLSHVNSMIANLPQGSDAPEEEKAESPSAPPAKRDERSLPPPAPRQVVKLLPPATDVNFQKFAVRIVAGDVIAAGEILAELFGLHRLRGIRAAQSFYDKLHRDRQALFQVLELRDRLATPGDASAETLLREWFGLDVHESRGVLRLLQLRRAAAL